MAFYHSRMAIPVCDCLLDVESLRFKTWPARWADRHNLSVFADAKSVLSTVVKIRIGLVRILLKIELTGGWAYA